jgi:hypothetical protein
MKGAGTFRRHGRPAKARQDLLTQIGSDLCARIARRSMATGCCKAMHHRHEEYRVDLWGAYSALTVLHVTFPGLISRQPCDFPSNPYARVRAREGDICWVSFVTAVVNEPRSLGMGSCSWSEKEGSDGLSGNWRCVSVVYLIPQCSSHTPREQQPSEAREQKALSALLESSCVPLYAALQF